MSMMIFGPSKDTNTEGQNQQTKNEKSKYPFSKVLLIQESVLIWLVTLACLVMAFICIFTSNFIELPWISAMVACPWGAYAITQNAYYKKSMMENTQGGIVYDGLFGAPNPNAAQDGGTETPVG